ncbi:MAG: hypothetical protein NZ807_12550, partial [Dehalococcoidia bacterium]|nr:hypothetical protein [Dehalococcoidia bacterium]
KLFGITYANSTFVAVGRHETILSSSNEVSSFYESTELALYNLDDDFPENVTVAVSSSNTAEATVDTATLTFTPDNWMNAQTVTVTGVNDNDMDGHKDYQVGLSSEILQVLSAGTSWSSQDPGVSNAYLNVEGIKGIAYGNDTFVAVGEYGVILTSSDGSTWTSLGVMTSNQSSLNGISFGNNTFVAVGESGSILTSTNGTSWEDNTNQDVTSGGIYGVTYGNGIFVAVGYYGSTLTSSDGTSWESRPQYLTQYGLRGVAYGNGIFVAVGEYGTRATSPDGTSWELIQGYLTQNTLRGVAYGNGTFVAVGDYGVRTYPSPDGIAWVLNQEYITQYNLNGVAFGNNTFVAVVGDDSGYSGAILSSADGETWTEQDSSENPNGLSGITYANSTFVAVGSHETILSSSNEVSSFYESTQLALYNLDDDFPTDVTVAVSSSNTAEATVRADAATLTFTPDNWDTAQTVTVTGVDDNVIDGHKDYQVGLSSEIIQVLSAGTSWSSEDAGLSGMEGIKGIAYGNDTFVAVGEYGVILTSSDGSTWTQRNSSNQHKLNGITFGNNTFVAVGETGTILTSTNGTSWEDNSRDAFGNCWFPDCSSVTYGGINGVTFGNGTFVVVANNGVLLTSSDGTSWERRSQYLTQNNLRGVTYGNGTFVAVGDNGARATSSDGTSWELNQENVTQETLYGVAYGNGTFVAVGNYGVGATSADGSNWSVNYITGTNINGVAFGDNTFVAAIGDEYGYYGTIFTSADGVTWTEGDSAYTQHSLSGITYANSTFVAVGFNGTILTSSSEVSSFYESTQLSLYNLDDDFPEDVTVAVSSSNTEESTVDTATLTFTPDNWDDPQTVTVTGVNDDDIDGHKDYQV